MNTFNYKGRATCSDMWTFQIGSMIIAIALVLILSMIANEQTVNEFINGLQLIIIIIGVSLTIRRFHDLNLSAWYILSILIPLYNWYVCIQLYFFSPNNTTMYENDYGPDPRITELFEEEKEG
jgi:uncharacterized membrane protein YhaH (DUF805 family)